MCELLSEMDMSTRQIWYFFVLGVMYAAVFRFRFSLDFLEIIHIDTCVYAFSNTAMRYSAILLWCYIYLNKLCAITSTSSTKKICKKIREIKAFWDIIIDSKEKHKEKSFNLWENHSSEKKRIMDIVESYKIYHIFGIRKPT